MKRKFFAAVSASLCLLLLSGCNSNVIKTKELSSDVTQTPVVINNTLSQNEEYNSFLKLFKPSYTVPGLLEGVIPQGLCYVEKLGAFIVSGYYEDAAYPSVFMLVDKDSGKLVSYHPLKNIDKTDYSGHAGGVATSGNYIFMTSDNECNVISTASLKNAKNAEPVQFESNFKLTTGGAFTCVHDGILWSGDFIESSDDARGGVENVTTLKTGETFYAYAEGYTLKDGLPDVEKLNSDNSGYIPDYYMAIPEQVQGMAVQIDGSVVFTTSYGRKNNSVLYIFNDVISDNPVDSINIDGENVSLFACSADKLKRELTAPPMAEGIDTADGITYLLFESGAAKYRNHGGKYPSDTFFTAEFN